MTKNLEDILANFIKESAKGFSELRELQKKTDEQINELKESQKKTDEQQKKTDEQQKKTDEQLKKTIRKLDWMWVTQWDITEDIFYSNFEWLLKKEWKKITKVIRNLDFPWKVEFDIVWINGSEVFVAEVKTRLTKEHIDKFIEKRLSSFRKYALEYKNYKLYGVVAWRVITKEIEDYANNKWLYIMKELHNWTAELLNSKDFQAKEYVF